MFSKGFILKIFKIRDFVTFVLVCMAWSLSFNSCSAKKEQKTKADEPENVTPLDSPNKSSTPSTTPPVSGNSPSPVSTNSTSVTQEAKPAPVLAVTEELFSQIKEGQHALATYAIRTRLLTKEAQRCRETNASLVKQGAIYPGINPNRNPEEIVSAYRTKHRFPNFGDRCRQELGLTGSLGQFMRLENLIELENCVRQSDIQKQQNLNLRTAARELLLMENLILICRLEQESFSPLVQNAISSGFIETWIDLGK